MKKLTLLATALIATSALAQNYKMRVLKTDGSEIFYPTEEVKQVDFVEYNEDEPKEIKVFLAGDNVNQDGPMKLTKMENIGPGGGNILVYPTEMSNDPYVKHGVIIWGPGGGSKPSEYMGIINRLASHGFVVMALRESPGSGDLASAALDWLEEKSNDPNGPLYNRIITDRVGCAGHSMGGLESEQALIKDKRVVTAALNNSGDLNHSAMTLVPTDKTAMIVYGEAGMEAPNAEADYGNNGVKCPACLIKMVGNNWGHGSGPWSGMAATVAWMRWQIGGEDHKSEFTTPNGQYVNGNIIGDKGYWNGKYKNW
ncbi:MAG: hypothetical protein J6I79_01665 [Paludibacteraceae bacterium]|nr:hypothetical protein [Paludibacteraceae bacterium]